jgi:hypothetical protein
MNPRRPEKFPLFDIGIFFGKIGYYNVSSKVKDDQQVGMNGTILLLRIRFYIIRPAKN